MAFDMNGFRELQDELNRMTNDVSRRVTDQALKAGAQPIFEQMQANTTRPDYMKTGHRVKSGKMKASLRIRPPRNIDGERKVTIGIHRKDSPQDGNTGAHYANPVEFGHGGPAPAPEHPFIRMAYDMRVNESYQEMVKVLKNNIGK